MKGFGGSFINPSNIAYFYSPRYAPKEMRKILDKKHFTKPERIFWEILKRNQLSFETKVKIEGREIDFLIGKVAVEIGNHSQDVEKNSRILENGFHLLFITNAELYSNPKAVEFSLLTNWIKL